MYHCYLAFEDSLEVSVNRQMKLQQAADSGASKIANYYVLTSFDIKLNLPQRHSKPADHTAVR